MGDDETSGTDDTDSNSGRTLTSAQRTSLSLTFWYLVFLFNIALLALSLGVLLVIFESEWAIGSALILIGGAIFVLGYYRYRHHRYSTP